jgi:PAS domain S-box-containing protein
LFDITRTEVIGKTDYELFPKDVADKLRANDRRVLNEGKPITIDETVPNSNGEMREYVVTKYPIPSEAGRPHSLCGIATDITDQKRQLRALEETRRRFTAFMDNSPLLAWIKDADGRYVFVNRRTLEVMQLRADQMLGKTDFDLFPEETARSLRDHDLEVLADGTAHDFREFCPIGSGPPLPWQSCKFRLQGDDGSYLIGGVALDATTANV